MAKKEKPWLEYWDQVKQLPGGGQCNNFIVKSNKGGNEHFVLKVIKEETDIERRTRFYREVHNYIALNHASIPRIIDHNCIESPEGENRLFMVYQYVDGFNLEEFIKSNGPLTLADAIKLVNKLLEILNFIHHNDIIHRDFKPDNIILRHNNIEDPVLIDFGLSAAIDDQPLSESGEKQIGNRFLHLPELKYNSGNKRDKRSDITYLIGIFFFVLTGEVPAQLLDEQTRYPHQRIDLKNTVNVTANQIGLLKKNI